MHVSISYLAAVKPCEPSEGFSGFSGEVKTPPATLSMVAGGGGLVPDIHELFMPLATVLDPDNP